MERLCSGILPGEGRIKRSVKEKIASILWVQAIVFNKSPS